MRDVFFLSCGEFVAPGVAIRPPAEWARRPLKAVRMTNTVGVAVRDNGDIVLVDAGWDGATCASPVRELGRVRKTVMGVRVRAEDAIASQLRRLDLDPSRVRAIVATHLHLDHVGGSRTSRRRPSSAP